MVVELQEQVLTFQLQRPSELLPLEQAALAVGAFFPRMLTQTKQAEIAWSRKKPYFRQQGPYWKAVGQSQAILRRI